MARNSEDCAILLDALAGGSERLYAGGLAWRIDGLRIGVVDLGRYSDNLHPDVARAWETARRALESVGARIGTARLPPLDLFSAVVTVLASVEGFVLHRDYLAKAGDIYDPLTRQRILAGEKIRGSLYVDALAMRQSLSHEVAIAFEGFDLLLMPMTYSAARLLGDFDSHGGHPSLGRPWNVIGAPALSVRAGFNCSGLPLAVQLVGLPGADGLVLTAGHALDLVLSIGDIWPDLARTTRAPATPSAIVQPDQAALAAATEAALERILGAGTRPGALLRCDLDI